MIRPFKLGRELLDEIENDDPGASGVSIWWLGQSGYVVKGRSGVVVIDPYLSEHLTTKYAATDKPHVRMTEAPFRGADFVHADLILATHKHSDHMDPGTLPDLMRASPRARLVLPASLLEHAVGLGLPAERCVPVDAGWIGEPAPGIVVEALPAAHEGLDKDAAGRHLYLSYAATIDGVRLYHSGDTVVYPGLAEALGSRPLDVAFLPINGRKPERGVPGNMTAAEAVELAGRVGPRFVVPHHYDMFTFNTVPSDEFVNAAARLTATVVSKVLRCGERWRVGAWA